MIRCIRIWTDSTGNSTFEEGSLPLPGGTESDEIGQTVTAASISFRETRSESALAWHDAPIRQFVLTLGGTLQFETRSGATFIIRPGDVLLAEDTAGSGHRWRIIGSEPWRRAYVVLPPSLDAHFTPTSQTDVERGGFR
jgi:hypothetical protein